ncbi:DNA-binding domain-containing protein [Photobacterium sp.]|uniref:HvfC/BufC N-terminal domain-containing protein n=1 Tax=Photobacterium sp. TaxID=660 RepID=UPI00299D6B96|nr:DNA-binding domain-containing protein [Photobacterium sp.]MDX1303941.1 DNA-binding domain-containing protein [Photobacterium sp.]
MATLPSPNSPLHQLQHAFAEALHYQPSDISEQIARGPFKAEQLIQIYRNNFIIGLSEVLEATYPGVKAVVGDECFGQLARQHVLSHPLRQGDVSHYGEGLADTINDTAKLSQAVPYLADLARLEWCVDRVACQPVIEPGFPLHKLQGLAEADFPALQFTVPQPTLSVDSDFAVVTLWQMIADDNFADFDINQPESAVIQHRPDQILVMKTNQAATALIALSQHQQSLSAASDAMLLMLGELVQRQIFSDVNIKPDSTDENSTAFTSTGRDHAPQGEE